MKHVLRHHLFIYLAGLFFFVFVQCSSPPPTETEASSVTTFEDSPLYKYVYAEDPAFQYELVHSNQEEGYRYFVLKVISQHWLSEEEVDQTEWWHWVSFVVPESLEHETGLVMISGGSTNSKLPVSPDPMILKSAMATSSVAVKVHNIPFQPVTFKEDTMEGRVEDELIAYGWRKFMEAGARDEDAVWLARLPMTKAVVKGVDAVSDYLSKDQNITLDKYVVAGGSKRGWTTWTTAAVDKRVVAMAPIVIDLLNVVPSFQHHWRSYGFWAPAVKDYVHEGIMDWMGTKEFDRLLEITEPYSFRDRFDNIPKLLINGSGDQFFLPDSWQFYWDDLNGEKHLAYIPNAGHGLDGSDAVETLVSFYSSVLENRKRPEYSWIVSDNGFQLKTDPDNPPSKIQLWQAHNEEARDFRIDVFGDGWTAMEIPINTTGIYEVNISSPEKGWRGQFMELTYPEKIPLKVTSGIKVLPETYPFEEYVPNVERRNPVVLEK